MPRQKLLARGGITKWKIPFTDTHTHTDLAQVSRKSGGARALAVLAGTVVEAWLVGAGACKVEKSK